MRQGVFVEGVAPPRPQHAVRPRREHEIDPHIAGVAGGVFTIGGVRDILSRHGLEGGVGAGLTLYATRALLDPFYGSHPNSFQVFFRLRSAEHMVNMQ